MFGTLHVPSAQREVAGFGVEADRADAHTLWGELIAPFGKAALRLKELAGGAPRPETLPASLPAPDRTRA
jgi:hypothetical protein